MENTLEEKNLKIQVKKPAFMLASKIILILAAITLYVMQAMIAIPLIGVMNETNTGDLDIPSVGIVLVITLALGLIAFIVAIIGAVRNEAPASLFTPIIKAVLIPFFCINLFLWVMGFSAMLNPFLFLGIPFLIVIGVCLTYIYMFMTGAPDIIYTIIFCIKNKKRPSFLMIAGIILCFIFVLDVIGSVLLHIAFKKNVEIG